jgi:hypothetical protein
VARQFNGSNSGVEVLRSRNGPLGDIIFPTGNDSIKANEIIQTISTSIDISIQ